MTELNKKQMEEILLAHEMGELECDLEATMATLIPNPHYELPALGWAIDGEAGVREVYNRIFAFPRKFDVAAEKRVHAIADNTLIREAWVSFDTPEGKRLTGQYIVVMSFDPELKLISGERMYMDTNFAAAMARELGDDIGEVPGVSKIDESAPDIAIHDAYAVAESKGLTINKPTSV